MALRDAGIAHDHWKKFYTPEEVEEIQRVTMTTTIVSCGHPIHVRIYPQPRPAPTVIMACPMLPYGLLLARLQLPFFRAGFNVVQWDLPGWGQSGGAHAGCPVWEIMQTWKDSIDFAHSRFGEPLFGMGLAEDSITCYYTNANHPWIRAMSLHTLLEYGDPKALAWLGGPISVRFQTLAMRLGGWLRPGMGIKAERALPWDAIFSGPDSAHYLKLFADDPLRVRSFDFRLGASMMRRQPFPVRLEDCRTPTQLIVSEKSRLWPTAVSLSYFERIGSPKEVVMLEGVDQWVYTREFMEMYAAHAISWFKRNGAFGSSVLPHEVVPEVQAPRVAGRLSPEYVDQVRRPRDDRSA